MRRFVCSGVIAAGLLMVPSLHAHASAASFPSKPIRLVVPYPAGDSTDVIARIVGEELSNDWGQPVVVENRPGATGVVATQAVSRMPADGHNLIMVVNSHVLTGLTMPNLPYDPMKDFVPVATVVSTDLLLLTSPELPVNSVKELNQFAAENPGKVNFGALGTVGVGRVAYEMYRMQANAEFTRIPYTGSVHLVSALASGQVDVGMDVVSTFLPHVQSGRIKALAITGDERSPALPDVPTFKEAGMPDYEMNMWYGILAPRGTPQEIVDKLSAKVGEVLQRPAVIEKLKGQEMKPYIHNAQQFQELMWRDHERLGEIVKVNNIRQE